MFFLPIGDTPNPRRFIPWVNWGLIAANVLVYLATLPLSFQPVDPNDPAVLPLLRLLQASGADVRALLGSLSAYDLFTLEHGYKPGLPSASDLFTAMFIHGGFGHLAGNMLFLWIYGDNVEHRLGRVPYLLAYLLTGAIATLSYGLLAGPSTVPLVGASGAISGVLGFYFFLFPRNEVKILFVFFMFIVRVFLVPSRLVLALYVIWDNLLPVLTSAGGSTAYGAHLGGFFAGLGLAWVGERLDWRIPGAHRPEPHPDAATLQGAHLGADEVSARVEVLLREGREAEAVRLLRRSLPAARQPGQQARLMFLLGIARLRQGQTTAAWQNLLAALELDPDPATEARIRRALAAIR